MRNWPTVIQYSTYADWTPQMTAMDLLSRLRLVHVLRTLTAWQVEVEAALSDCSSTHFLTKITLTSQQPCVESIMATSSTDLLSYHPHLVRQVRDPDQAAAHNHHWCLHRLLVHRVLNECFWEDSKCVLKTRSFVIQLHYYDDRNVLFVKNHRSMKNRLKHAHISAMWVNRGA